jgi:hypothetical protein
MGVTVNIDLKKAFASQAATAKERVLHKLVKDLKEATPVDTGKARDGWRLDGNKIVNDVEYIDSLNAGHSQQAPSHFIEKTLLSDGNVIPNGVMVTSKI